MLFFTQESHGEYIALLKYKSVQIEAPIEATVLLTYYYCNFSQRFVDRQSYLVTLVSRLAQTLV